MIIRAKAPLRVGFAGGGTDVSPYCDKYGGAVLNATIDMFAYCTLEPRDDGKIIFSARDIDIYEEYDSTIELNSKLALHKGIYNRIVRDYNGSKPLSFKMTTYSDAPPGSGLGSSSTMVVAIIKAYMEWLNLPLGEYDMAMLAYVVEREDLKLSGGKQDQYAATFGGVNFMEFFENDKVIVNPLRIKDIILDELNYNLILFWTEVSRISADIIQEQQKNVSKKESTSVEAMHKIKEQAILMKEALLKGELDKIGEILDFGWKYKKQMASSIVTPQLEKYYNIAKDAGASGGKISGAGGGGFMFFYCPENTRNQVVKALSAEGGVVKRYQFTEKGLRTWTF